MFGLLIVVGVLIGGPLLGALALSTGSGSSPALVALGIGVNTIVVSFTALTTALLYFDLQAREMHPRRSHEHQYIRDLDPVGDP